jgi:hypothetical protein
MKLDRGIYNVSPYRSKIYKMFTNFSIRFQNVQYSNNFSSIHEDMTMYFQNAYFFLQKLYKF